jgi:diamine N-acetyltransferase
MMNECESISRGAVVNLREITGKTVRKICNLEVTEDQNRFVAPNAVSISQAYFESKAWFRAIYADETPVGFLMLYDNPDEHEYFLWRYMIDAQYQGLGFGRQAVELLVEHVKTRPGAMELLLSCVPEEGGPELFYEKCGFKRTGEMHGIEVEMRRVLS